MKIKKEFIPLILSGKKIHEFRNNDKCEGIYKIGDEYYLLEYLGGWELGKDDWLLQDDDEGMFIEYEKFYGNTGDYNILHVDTASLKFINENKEYGDFDYFDGKRCIHIYEWQKYLLKELEIV